jgi:hypothetical protein
MEHDLFGKAASTLPDHAPAASMPLYRDGLKRILTYEPCASLAGSSGDWSEG